MCVKTLPALRATQDAPPHQIQPQITQFTQRQNGVASGSGERVSPECIIRILEHQAVFS